MLKKEERAAQYAAALKWVSWIREVPAGGFRRQHRFSRNADGWAATQKSTGNIADVRQQDEIDELEGLSTEDLNNLKYHQGKAGTPATAQHEADDQADSWHKHWGGRVAGGRAQVVR